MNVLDEQKMEENGAPDIVERALALLLALTGSGTGAIFGCEDGSAPRLQASVRIDQGVLDRVQAAWTYGRDALECGERIEVANGAAILPVLSSSQLLALIYLERVADCPAQDLDMVCSLIANRCGSHPPETHAPLDDEREHLLRMLSRNEWNIARVARLLGVSRLTVYRRLERLGVTRPTGPKRYPGSVPQTT